MVITAYHKQCFCGRPEDQKLGASNNHSNDDDDERKHHEKRQQQQQQKRNFPSRAVLECELEFFDIRGLSWPGSLATAEETPDTSCSVFSRFGQCFTSLIELISISTKHTSNTTQRRGNLELELLLAGNRFSAEKVCHYTTSTCAIGRDKKVA